MRELLAKPYRKSAPDLMEQAFGSAQSGKNAINLSIGDTDFTTDVRIIEAAARDAKNGYTHYTRSAGDPELVEAICQLYQEEYAQEVAANEVFVAASSCYAMPLCFLAMLDEGDEVILLAPYFTPYKAQIELAGGVAVEVACREEEGFAPNLDRIRAAITPKTKAIVVNNPCNPTGAAYDRACLEGLAQLVQEQDLFVLADEIYTDFVYDTQFVPLRSLPGMAQRTITLNSASKNLSMTGWRIGWVIAPAPLIKTVVNLSENFIYCAPSISQRAALAALRLRREEGLCYRSVYEKRVAYAAKRIEQMPLFSVRPASGTFYLFLNITATGLDSAEFCRQLKQQQQLSLVPGRAFGEAGEGYARIACTVDDKTLAEAMDRLERFVSETV